MVLARAQLLDRSLKMFIKTACCFPERITKKDYDSILTGLKHSEKVGYYTVPALTSYAPSLHNANHADQPTMPQ